MVDADQGIFQALRAWRAEVADREGVPAFLVLTNRQLAEVARSRPRSIAGLGAVPGIGPGRLRKYAKAILEVVSRCAEPEGAESDSLPGADADPSLLAR